MGLGGRGGITMGGLGDGMIGTGGSTGMTGVGGWSSQFPLIIYIFLISPSILIVIGF